MRWYVDNSELNGMKEAEIPDILMFGGIVVGTECERDLRTAVESVKARYASSRAPVKWNFKDLKPMYQRQGKEDMYQELLMISKNWRQEIFESIKKIDFTIIVACVESNSAKKEVIKNIKTDLTQYAFSNGLMRYALHVAEKKPQRAEVVLDWPDRGDPKPFDVEYASAYKTGKTADASVNYHSGSLEKLAFSDHVVYANMKHSTLLQLADLVVGATRELIECSVGKAGPGMGIDVLKLVVNRFRGFPDKIMGYGISVASNSSEFKDIIREGIKVNLC